MCRYFFGLEIDIFIGLIYILSEASVVHNDVDIDFDSTLERDTTKCSLKDKILILGDFNNRVAEKGDFMSSNNIHLFFDIDEELIHVKDLPERKSQLIRNNFTSIV